MSDTTKPIPAMPGWDEIPLVRRRADSHVVQRDIALHAVTADRRATLGQHARVRVQVGAAGIWKLSSQVLCREIRALRMAPIVDGRSGKLTAIISIYGATALPVFTLSYIALMSLRLNSRFVTFLALRAFSAQARTVPHVSRSRPIERTMLYRGSRGGVQRS